jgi:hypothetical protein
MQAMWHKTGNTLPVMVNGRQMGSKKVLLLHTNKNFDHSRKKKELRLAEDQLGDAPAPPRGPGAREGAGAGHLQDFLPDEH